MAFDKKLHLKRNIDAIKTAFRIEKERRTATSDEINLLQQFSGFGGLKSILNPDDINQWRSSDSGYFALTQELFAVIRDNADNDSVYRQYVSSLKGSILDAFFTPSVISEGIATVIKNTGIQIDRILEPSAGVGAFIRPFSGDNDIQITVYEQDLITGKILKQLYGDEVDVRIEGFENISEHDGVHIDSKLEQSQIKNSTGINRKRL